MHIITQEVNFLLASMHEWLQQSAGTGVPAKAREELGPLHYLCKSVTPGYSNALVMNGVKCIIHA